MFPCACSLRSTQCAALIALATAAGISRFEPASIKTSTPPPALALGARETVSVVPPDRSQSYFALLNALVPQVRILHATVHFEFDRPIGKSLFELFAFVIGGSRPLPALAADSSLTFVVGMM